MTDSGHTFERRTVLKTIAAGGAVASGAGFASAESRSYRPVELQRLELVQQELGDVETVEELFDTYGRAVTESLVENGFLSTDETPTIDSVVSRREFGEQSTNGIAAIGDGRRNGTHAIDVRVQQQTEAYDVEYHVHPELEEGYAVVTSLDGDARFTVTDHGSVKEVSPTDSCCPDSITCSGCGDTNCTTTCCQCDINVDVADDIYFDEERYCCEVIEGPDGQEECACTWNVWGCACHDTIASCPDA